MIRLGNSFLSISNPVNYVISKLRRDQPLHRFVRSCGIEGVSKKINEITFEGLLRESKLNREEVLKILKDQDILFLETLELPDIEFLKKPESLLKKIMELGYVVTKGGSLGYLFATNKISKLFSSSRIASSRKIVLCPSDVYAESWENLFQVHRFYNKLQIGNELWRSVLFYCLYDAYSLGASFIRIVHSFDSCEYSFKASNKTYSGKIDFRVIKGILNFVQSNSLNSEELYAQVFPLGKGSISIRKSGSSTNVAVDFRKVNTDLEENVLISKEKSQEKIKKPQHILLIDDDERFLAHVKRGIAAYGYKVSVSVSANDALHLYLSSNLDIDLVITDLHMPHVGGVELIKTIKGYNANLPIIALTSDENTDSEISLIRAGASAIVNKQDDPKLLFVWMQKLLGK